jgi:hypothetical protein
MTEEYQGKHEADLPPDGVVTPDGVNHELTVAADEESGTPPHVSAKVRSSVYVGCLIVNVVAIMLAGLLPLFGVITYEKAAAAGGVILVAINTVSAALAVGYRPTRPGSPVKPIE